MLAEPPLQQQRIEGLLHVGRAGRQFIEEEAERLRRFRQQRGGQKTERSPTMRGMPETSSGAICVPSSERQGRPASRAAS